MPKESNTNEIIVGRGRSERNPKSKPEDRGTGGHPLPASGEARHDSIPESLERKKGHGAN